MNLMGSADMACHYRVSIAGTYLHGFPVDCLRPGFMALHEGEEQVTTQLLRCFHLQERVHEQAETLVVDVLKQP